MDLLQSLQAFAAMQEAKVSKEDRTKLAKQLGYSKDPLEMTLTEFANEAMQGSPHQNDPENPNIKQPLQEKDLLAARMLQNLQGIGVLNPDTFYDTRVSPLQRQILKQYYYQNPDLTFVERKDIQAAPSGILGRYIPRQNQLKLNEDLFKRENLLNLLSTLAHESQHQTDRKSISKVPRGSRRYNYTNDELQALAGEAGHHAAYRNFDLEAPLYNEAQLALRRGEQIPEWMFNWQPQLLTLLNELQQRPKTPVPEGELLRQLFLTNGGGE